MLLVEADVFALVGHDFDVEVVGKFFLGHFDHGAGNALALVVGMDEYIMDKGHHFAVI